MANIVIGSWVMTGGRPVDFLTYKYAVTAAWQGVDIYRGEVSGPSLPGQPFTYTPFAALVMTPLALLPWRAAYLAWSAATVAVLWAVLARVLPGAASYRLAARCTLVALTSCVLVSNIVYGQVDIFLMGLVLLDLLRRDDGLLARALPRGTLVGLAAAIKLTPALFVVYFLVTRQWRSAAAATCSAAAAAAVAAACFPTMTRTFVLHTLWSLTDRVDLDHGVGYWGNTSLTGAITALGPAAAPFTRPAVAVAGALFLAAAWWCHRRGRELDAWLVVGLAAPMLSPFTWQHHVVYLIPALTRLYWLHRLNGSPRYAPAGGPTSPYTRTVAVVVTLALALGPASGHAWITTGNVWAVVPGVVQREVLIILSVLSTVALVTARDARPTSPSAVRRRIGWDFAGPWAGRACPAQQEQPYEALRQVDPERGRRS